MEGFHASLRNRVTTLGTPVVSPLPEFYEVFDEQNVLNIADSLERHHELPRAFSYFGSGARHWDDSVTLQPPRPDIAALRDRLPFLDEYFAGRSRLDVVDVGPGNGDPARVVLSHLLARGVLGRYLAIDVSPGMLKIAENRLRTWFGSSAPFEGHVLDIGRDRFDHLVPALSGSPEGPVRDPARACLALLLGGTLGNLRSPEDALGNVRGSLGRSDLLAVSERLDECPGPSARPGGARRGTAPPPPRLSPFNRFLLDLLGIPESLYAVEFGIDPRRDTRFIRVRLGAPVRLRLRTGAGERHVDLSEGTPLELWRYWRLTPAELAARLARSGLEPVFAGDAAPGEFILSLSRPCLPSPSGTPAG
ncbi:MAG: hypothetical protein QG622_1419 [Actinomycetota bacterium]|nr:hypothetical protein [Actinomycetota bacterium]